MMRYKVFLDYRICSFCSPGPYFFQPNSLPGPYSNGPLFKRDLIQARALVIFKVKLCTKIIVEDKYFTTLILFPCQFIHVKRKLFTSKE